MKTKKPDIFLGITMGMLVLAAVLCIVILFVNKNAKDPTPSGNTLATDTNNTVNTGKPNQDTNTPSNSDNPIVPPVTDPVNPVNLEAIDQAQLKADLDESLRGLTSEWQVMVIDPWDDTKVSSSVTCKVDDWMTANRMTPVFIMGTVFQQAADGTMTLDEVMEDVKAMLGGDTYAADRLTDKLGGGDAAKGREAVKAFAVANGSQLGFNRPNTGTANKKNYVTAQKCAEFLSLICKGELVSKEASAQMLELLLTCANAEDIDTGVTGEGVRCGFIHDVEEKTCICTMGVVKTNDRYFVISVVCNKPVTTDGAKKKVKELITLTQPYFEK